MGDKQTELASYAYVIFLFRLLSSCINALIDLKLVGHLKVGFVNGLNKIRAFSQWLFITSEEFLALTENS